jgi:hypothetical protein
MHTVELFMIDTFLPRIVSTNVNITRLQSNCRMLSMYEPNINEQMNSTHSYAASSINFIGTIILTVFTPIAFAITAKNFLIGFYITSGN